MNVARALVAPKRRPQHVRVDALRGLKVPCGVKVVEGVAVSIGFCCRPGRGGVVVHVADRAAQGQCRTQKRTAMPHLRHDGFR